jgi:hypothetical protein
MRRFASRLLRALPAALLPACASSGGGAPVEQSRVVVGSSTPVTPDIELIRDTRLAVHRSAFTPDQVWAALPAALADFGLTGGPQLGQTRTYVALLPRVRRALNKVPLSRYLECGVTSSGAPGADSHVIRLQVTSIVEPDQAAAGANGARMRTQVMARATPVEGAAGVIECSTTGVFEARLAETLEQRLRQP